MLKAFCPTRPPVERSLKEPAESRSRALAGPFGKEVTMTKKVLLVDDSSTMLMMEQAILRQLSNCEVLLARDGQEAVEKAASEKPDLILMDVVMPRLNGMEACQQLRQQATTRTIPVILVTTRGEQESVESGYVSGCSDYVTKPIDEREFLAIVRNYLEE